MKRKWGEIDKGTAKLVAWAVAAFTMWVGWMSIPEGKPFWEAENLIVNMVLAFSLSTLVLGWIAHKLPRRQ